MQDPKFLVAAAREGDAEALNLLREYARGARRTGMNVPNELHEFVWEFFIDGKPPAPSGTNSKDTDLRKQTIALLVKIVHQDYGFPLYGNVEHRGEDSGPMTTFRLVGEELGLAARTIEGIWEDRKTSVQREPGTSH
jgi:hypothetical protein